MIRGIYIAIAAVLMMVGCGGQSESSAPPASATKTVADAVTDASSATEEGAGQITARLFRRNAADGEFIGPSLEVFSPNVSEAEPGVMNFGDAQVTIFAEDGQQVVITAKNGVLDQNEETAELTGEVVVMMGSQILTMEQLSWNNEKREAITRTKVKIVDGDTVLTADGMRFSPDENTLTLDRVTGEIRLPGTGPSAQARAGQRTWRTLAMWLIMATPVHAQVGGDTAYTHVVIEKPAPEVVFRDNRLDQMTGGVEIQLETADENEPPLILGADTIIFGWKEDAATELASLDMTGNVSVSNNDGQMWAADAEFDVGKMVIVFSGGVNGRFEGIDEFQADRLTYQIESGDMEMRNLRATIPFADDQGGDAASFSQMKVERAAVVHIVEGKVQDMNGGVEVKLTPEDASAKPITLNAETFWFSYADASQRQPDSVSMEGEVHVDSPQGLIQSNNASFGVSSGLIKFRGNVRGRSDVLKSFRANSFDYDLDTEDGILTSFRADGVQMGDSDGGYDRMDVRRAPEVRMRGGRVTNMSGGVEIYMAGDAERASLTAKAQSIDIAYAGSSATAPSAVNMKDDVNVTTGETVIFSDTADLNMQTEAVDFVGNFRAEFPKASGINGTSANYNLKTGDFTLYGGGVDELSRSEPEENPEQP
jgi:lipopolysaccharide export system protein LptA